MGEYFRKCVKEEHRNMIPIAKFKTNFTNCILEAFQQRGYERTEGEDWDIIWSEKEHIPQIYEKRLLPTQRVNHFKNYYQLCKKDMLIRNLKKHKKLLERNEKEGKQERQGKHEKQEKNESGQYNFYPQTYVLPNQYVLFVDEFKKVQGDRNTWIMKPTGKSQGKGIFLFNKISQISQWEHHSAEPYIVQKYISEPLLIGGKKFDIRIYALVVSYSPLTVYLYRGGFARFTHCRYEESKIQQSQIHLTNVAIQKNAEGYDESIGGKWYLHRLKSYLISSQSEERVNECFLKIQQIVIKTLEAVVKVMVSDKPNSFQLYGFDILLDSKFQPWLIEVNGSPSMTANTPIDRDLKIGLLDDTLTVLDYEKHLLGNEEQIGGFDLICGRTKRKKVSLLGTHTNRMQNLKKLAKGCSARLNEMYEAKKAQKRVKVPSSQKIAVVPHCKNTLASQKIIGGGKGNGVKALSSHNTPTQTKFVIKKMRRQGTCENEMK